MEKTGPQASAYFAKKNDGRLLVKFRKKKFRQSLDKSTAVCQGVSTRLEKTGLQSSAYFVKKNDGRLLVKFRKKNFVNLLTKAPLFAKLKQSKVSTLLYIRTKQAIQYVRQNTRKRVTQSYRAYTGSQLHSVFVP